MTPEETKRLVDFLEEVLPKENYYVVANGDCVEVYLMNPQLKLFDNEIQDS